ncbi:histone H1.01-like [Rhinoderma darwinii]|uniref:histone H1.01-like n=1 Tax=Rhinoderma darwinii TaxID=43563 RepID=UPI003F663ACF
MAETAPAAAVPLTEPAAKSKKQPKKTAAGVAKKIKKPSGPSVSELIVKAVSASKERSGVSLAALKKALAAGGYDVDKKNSRLKMALKTLVTKETLLQVKGSGASGSFKLNKKQLETKDKAVKKKPAAAGKSPKKTPAKSLTKAKRPAAAKKVAKSPKKPKPAPKKITKSPAKKAAKPKAAKSPAKKAPKATKSPAKKAAKSPAKKAPKAAKSPAKKAAKSPAKKAPKAAKSPAKKASKSRKTVAKK